MGDDNRNVRLPTELASVPSRPLEDYVRARILQFASAFANRINPALSAQVVQRAANETVSSLPAPEPATVALESRDLQLVFRHDCLSLGCLDPQCVLCEHNPHRRCNVNFAPKYLVNDILKAKCDAPIRVEIIDRLTGVPLADDIPDVHFEMCILDGNAYDAKCLESGSERDEDLEACALLLNNKGQALLVPGAGGVHNNNSKVVVQMSRGMAQLPDIHVSDSSEAMLSGRKPPFRLLVKAVHSRGKAMNIRHAVSEGFVVATRRTRTAGKVEIPNVDDHVSKLEHMGKETVKKLQDLKLAAVQAGVEINVPDNCINKVGEFRKLSMLAEADGHLRQKLQQVLKLSKEKWDDARDHAMRAVVADNRMRIWYADKNNMEVGLLFTCRLGNVDLDRPVGLLQKKSQDGTQTTMEATLMAQQTPAQREQVRQLQPQGVAAWWQPGHPGWAIYPVDSEQFMTTGALETVSMPAPEQQIIAPVPPAGSPIPGAPPSPSPAQQQFPILPGQNFQPSAFANAHAVLPAALAVQNMQNMQPQFAAANLQQLHQNMGYLPSNNSNMQQLLAAQQQMRPPPGMPAVPTQQQQQQAAMRPPQMRSSTPPAPQGNKATPFASASAQNAVPASQPQNTPPQLRNAGVQAKGAQQQPVATQPTLDQLASINFPMVSGNLPMSFTFANFPSLPGHLQSGDLDNFLPPGASLLGMPFNRMTSLGIGKLESMELPEPPEGGQSAAVAMLHDMGGAEGVRVGEANDGHALQRMGSGLESMQSIEQELNQVMDNVAEGWNTCR